MMKNSISIFLLCIALSGCQFPTTLDKSATTIQTAPVSTVILGGLDVNFLMNETDVIALGFKHAEGARPGYYTKFDVTESLPQLSISFTPKSKKLYSITGSRYYPIDHKPGACLKDLMAIDDGLRGKYPQLVLVKKPSWQPDSFTNREYCESKTVQHFGNLLEETGLQRCVEVSCVVLDNVSTLSIHYRDQLTCSPEIVRS